MKRIAFASARGFTLIEVLIAATVLVIGLLGLAALQATMTNAEFDAYQRAHAVVLLRDMLERINDNRAGFVNQTAVLTAGVGDGRDPGGACPTDAAQAVERALCEWSKTLQGASAQIGTEAVGAMIGTSGEAARQRYSEVVKKR